MDEKIEDDGIKQKIEDLKDREIEYLRKRVEEVEDKSKRERFYLIGLMFTLIVCTIICRIF